MAPQQTPVELGYRMPAEWEPHARTWLSWPHNLDSWPDAFEPIPEVWAELVRTLARFEPVSICAASGPVADQARALTAGLAGITVHDIPTNDAWMRDHGPTFLVGPSGSPPALVDWGYNAWGGKYPPYDLDDAVPAKIAAITGRRRFAPGVILEGGSVDPNGAGSVLTTEQCLLNPNRNPGLSRAAMEHLLAAYLAAPHVIWLGEGIAGDDTDGHIDELARFIGPRTVLAAVEPDPADVNHRPLVENWRRLELATDQAGRRLELVALPLPRPLWHGDQRMPASYLNFYIANGAVLVPQFDDPADAAAVETLARLFPDRVVCPLRAVDLAWGLGAYHCITQQEPLLPG